MNTLCGKCVYFQSNCTLDLVKGELFGWLAHHFLITRNEFIAPLKWSIQQNLSDVKTLPFDSTYAMLQKWAYFLYCSNDLLFSLEIWGFVTVLHCSLSVIISMFCKMKIKRLNFAGSLCITHTNSSSCRTRDL